jgi:hypothetical protein
MTGARNVHSVEFAPDRFEQMDVSVLALNIRQSQRGTRRDQSRHPERPREARADARVIEPSAVGRP